MTEEKSYDWQDGVPPQSGRYFVEDNGDRDIDRWYATERWITGRLGPRWGTGRHWPRWAHIRWPEPPEDTRPLIQRVVETLKLDSRFLLSAQDWEQVSTSDLQAGDAVWRDALMWRIEEELGLRGAEQGEVLCFGCSAGAPTTWAYHRGMQTWYGNSRDVALLGLAAKVLGIEEES